MSLIDQDMQPPAVYDEKKIQKDLVQLSTKGYSLVPYQKRIKSKLYYRMRKKRIDAFFELVQAETEVWKAMREWRMELEKLRMVDIDVANLILEKRNQNLLLAIRNIELEKEYLSRSKSSQDEAELAALNKREEILKAQLRVARLEQQLDDTNKPQESSINQQVQDATEKLMGIAEILKVKQECEMNLRRHFMAQGFSKKEVDQILDDFDRIAKEEEIIPDSGI